MYKALAVALVLVIGGGAFYGGLKYDQSKVGNKTTAQQHQLGNGGGFRAGRGRGNGGELTTGDIIAKDDKTLTIKMRDGGSKIIFYSESTAVAKTVEGTLSDLEAGKTVMVIGSTNSDGSVAAESIQLRSVPPSAEATTK